MGLSHRFALGSQMLSQAAAERFLEEYGIASGELEKLRNFLGLHQVFRKFRVCGDDTSLYVLVPGGLTRRALINQLRLPREPSGSVLA